MRFTESNDGIERATVRIRYRLTREEWEAINRIAKERQCNPRDMLSAWLGLAIEDNIINLAGAESD